MLCFYPLYISEDASGKCPDRKTGKTRIKLLENLICLRKSEVSVGGKSVCNIIEKLAEHVRYCPPCSYTSDFIGL